MKKYWWIFILVLLLAGFSIYLYLKTITVRISVQNKIPNYRFRVSSLATNLFLYSQQYEKKVSKINVVFTTETQEAAQFYLENSETPASSMNVRVDGDTLTIWEQYTENAVINAMGGAEDNDNQVNLSDDFFAYLCMVLDEANPRKRECYQKVEKYNNSFGKFFPGKPVDFAKKLNFKLVKKALAACSGTIPCGADNTGWYCSISKESCPNRTCKSGSGSCVYGDYCDPKPNALDCSTIPNQSSCQSAGISRCALSCNTSGDTFCTWGGTATPPPGGGGCNCNCMSAIEPSCDSRVRSQRTINLTFLNSPTAKFARNAPSIFLLQFSDGKVHSQTATNLHSPNSPVRLFFPPHAASYIPMATYL